MAIGYNPYRTQNSDNVLNQLDINNNFFTNRLAKISNFGRNYYEVLKNSKATHANEDLTINDNTNQYSLYSRKINAILNEKTSIAALNANYLIKIPILREYAMKDQIQELVSKLTNEIIVYKDDKKFCEIKDLSSEYSQIVKKKIKDIFEDLYNKSGFNDGALALDICRDLLVEGYICREIIRDKKGKNIEGFMKLDATSVIPMIDEKTGIKILIQNVNDEVNRKILYDSEIIYISYSGSSNYMETSYVEPLIKPYNELKTIERTRLLFNLINATIHKEISIPMDGIPQVMQEQELLESISTYKDNIVFDNSTGEIYIDGSKDLPYSKEYFFPSVDGKKTEIQFINPEGHDLNENTTLVLFYNNFKRTSKFPFSKLDNTIGGGNIYTTGNEITNDDYNFNKYVSRLKTIFKEIIIKPVVLQLLSEMPELETNSNIFNDIDIVYYGNSELEKARELTNLQAKASIASELTNNLKKINKDGEEVPILHHLLILKHIMGFTDEQIAENDKYHADDKSNAAAAGSGGGSDMGGAETQPGGETPPISEPGGETPPEPGGETQTQIDTQTPPEE